jgi:hypothetical protein
VVASDGALMIVPDAAAFRARNRLRRAGLDPCMASSLAFAAVDECAARGLTGPDDRVLVMLSGSSRASSGLAELRKQALAPSLHEAWSRPADDPKSLLPGVVI